MSDERTIPVIWACGRCLHVNTWRWPAWEREPGRVECVCDECQLKQTVDFVVEECMTGKSRTARRGK